MTDVKRLLATATPLPWWHHKYDLIVDALGEPIAQVEDSEANAALIVHAVNTLPDYEAAVDALESVAWNQSDGKCWCDHPMSGGEITRHGMRCQKARAALARLRGAS